MAEFLNDVEPAISKRRAPVLAMEVERRARCGYTVVKITDDELSSDTRHEDDRRQSVLRLQVAKRSGARVPGIGDVADDGAAWQRVSKDPQARIVALKLCIRLGRRGRERKKRRNAPSDANRDEKSERERAKRGMTEVSPPP